MSAAWNLVILLSLLTTPVFAGVHGYRVTKNTVSVIQMARDLYGDQRVWKEIAQWNGLTPPYALSVGQTLVLKRTPKHAIPKEHQAVAPLAPDRKTASVQPPVRRKVFVEKGIRYYVVGERAPSLTMVALELYGDVKFYADIAEWNQLQKPYALGLGQKLRLKRMPTRSEKQGTALLVERWSQLANENMVARLSGARSVGKDEPAIEVVHDVIVPRKPAAKKPVPTKKREPVKKPIVKVEPKPVPAAEPVLERQPARPLTRVPVTHAKPPMVFKESMAQKPAVAAAPRMVASVEKPAEFVKAKPVEPKPEPKMPDAEKAIAVPAKVAVKPPAALEAIVDMAVPLPKVVAPQSSLVSSPVYIVQTHQLPVGSICITPPSALAQNPTWVVQPFPVGVTPNYVQPGVPSLARGKMSDAISAENMAMFMQMINGSGSGGGTGGSGGGSEGRQPAADPGPQFPFGNEPRTQRYWLGKDYDRSHPQETEEPQ